MADTLDKTLAREPYYDRYIGDSEHKKANYTRVLAHPGRAEQASEFNEIQSISRDYTSRIGKALLKDGYIVSGCALTLGNNKADITAGQIVINGLVYNTPDVSLQISGVGKELIIATLKQSIVTYIQDPTLRDPAQGSENYNQIGADREKEEVVFSVVSNSEDSPDGSVQVFELSDGVQVKETKTDNYAFINDILAERTYDENGNYKVSGLSIQKAMDIEGDKIRVYISAGKAYVKGYEVSKPYMSSVLLNASTDKRLVQSESHYYKSAISSYALTNGPVDSVVNFTCLVSVTKERIYRGSVPGGADGLTHTPVDSVTRVYTLGSDGSSVTKTYVQGRDYQLYSDQIDWSLSGDNAEEPSAGTTYYVDYVYNRFMVQGEDFKITNDGSTAYITFLSNGAKPDQNSRMYVSYNYTLARRDLILLDSSGNISVLEGIPDRYQDLLTPYNGSTSYIELGYITVQAKDALKGTLDPNRLAEVSNYDGVRLTQDNFLTMLRRIEYLEQSIAELDMERSIEEGEDTTSLGGYFTDSFENANKSDLGFVDTKNGISYTACIDYDRGELTTSAAINNYDLTVDSISSDKHAIYGTVISAPYTTTLALQQSYVTGTMKVNPYASYGPMCKVELSPSSDNWVDNKTVKLYNTEENATYTTDTKVYSHGWWSRNATVNLRGYLGTTTKTTTTYTGTTTSNRVATAVASTIIEYMRVRDITITGQSFGANVKNIKATFNTKPINLFALGNTVQGDNYTVGKVSYKTVNANGNGYFTAKITIPANTPCGEAQIVLTATNSLGETYSGQATYSAQGTLLTTTITNTKVITDHYKVLTEVDNTYSCDPLAQSFVLDTVYDRNLMSLGLYFATKSPTRPVIVQIRNMVNGYPGQTVYAEVLLNPADVNVPDKVNGTPVVTNVKLNQPVYCYAGSAYCFCVLSDSNEYSLYYANMGDNLLGTNSSLVVNPYSTGVMFSSSNASTWTAHQASDLKFELYRSVYTGSGEIIFNNVPMQDVTGIFLDAAYEVNSDDKIADTSSKTGLKWYYRYTDSSNNSRVSDWLAIDTLTYRDLQTMTSLVDLKAEITTDYSTSPFIDSSRVSLKTFTDAKKATYISKSISDSNFYEPYVGMKISYQAALPSGSSVSVYYMDTLNGNWVELVSDSSNVTLVTSTVDEEFTQYNWTIKKINKIVKDSHSSGSTFFKARIELTTNISYNRPRVKKFATIFSYA